MLTFSVQCGATTRCCYESAPLRDAATTGDTILLKQTIISVGDLLRLDPATAKVSCAPRPPKPPPKAKPGGPPPFKPFDVAAAARAAETRAPPPPPPPKEEAGLAGLEPGDRRPVVLVVEELVAGPDGCVIIRAGGERLRASGPLQAFLLRAGTAEKLSPHLAGKTMSLDVERTDGGFVVHNLS